MTRTAFETQRQADVEQLQQIGVGLRVLAQALQQLERLVAAPALFVEFLQQRAFGPCVAGV